MAQMTHISTKLIEASKTAQQAHKLGLTYAGHGYWKNASGKTVAVTKNGMLMKLHDKPGQMTGYSPYTLDSDELEKKYRTQLYTALMNNAELDIGDDESLLYLYKAGVKKFVDQLYDPQQFVFESPNGFYAASRATETFMHKIANKLNLPPEVKANSTGDIRQMTAAMHNRAKQYRYSKEFKQILIAHQRSKYPTFDDMEHEFVNNQGHLTSIQVVEERKVPVDHPDFDRAKQQAYNVVQYATPEETNVFKAWQDGGNIYMLNPSGRNQLYKEVTHAIGNNTFKTETPLYRGMALTPDELETFLRQFRKGSTVMLPPCGFSVDSRTAMQFSGIRNVVGNASIVFRLHPTDEKIKGVPVFGFGFYGEREVVVPGRVYNKVLNVKRYDMEDQTHPVYIIDIQQTGEVADRGVFGEDVE